MATEERLSGIIILFIFVGAIVSVLLGIISFASKRERKLIPCIAGILTVFNVSVIIFFLMLGAGFT